MAIAPEVSASGAFLRNEYIFQDRLAGEPGRYHIYWCHSCPWSQRTVIVRALLGLEEVIGATPVHHLRDERGWAFNLEPDPVNGFRFLSEAYLATDPAYKGRATVPCVWDKKQGRLATNFFNHITIDLETAFRPFARRDLDLYPEALRPEIDALNERIYVGLNNGVYRAGFARSQAAYEQAFDEVFAMLDELEERLGSRRYLVGEHLSEADIRLYPTLARFDAVYHGHFKCNLRRLVDYPHLWAYARDLYQRPAFRDTTNFTSIKRGYYNMPFINPNGIVPKGPAADWTAPHGRQGLGPEW